MPVLQYRLDSISIQFYVWIQNASHLSKRELAMLGRPNVPTDTSKLRAGF